MPDTRVGIRFVLENLSEFSQQLRQVSQDMRDAMAGSQQAGVAPSVPAPLAPHASVATPWGVRPGDDRIGEPFPGVTGAPPPYLGLGSVSTPASSGVGGGTATSIAIQSVATLTIGRVETLNIPGLGRGAGAGGQGISPGVGPGGGPAAAPGTQIGGGGGGAFDPDQTIQPGQWPPGPSAGGPGPGSGPAARRARRFGMYTDPFQFNQQAVQDLQDAMAAGDPFQIADAQQRLARSNRHIQNLNQAADDPLKQLGRIATDYVAAGALSSAIGGALAYNQAGGDITFNRAATNAVTGIPVLGGLLAPIIGPQVEREEAVKAAYSMLALQGLPTDMLGKQMSLPDPTGPAGTRRSTTVFQTNTPLSLVQAIMQLGQQGFSVPRELQERFRVPEGQPGYLRPELRGMVTGAYASQRTSLEAMGTLTSNEAPGVGSMASLAFGRGDYASAFLLGGVAGQDVTRMHSDRSVLMRAQNEVQTIQLERQAAAAERQRNVAFGVYRNDQGRLVGSLRGDISNAREQRENLFAQQEVFQQRMNEAAMNGDEAGVSVFRKRIAETSAQVSELQTQEAQSSMGMAAVPFTTGLRSRLSRSSFVIDVLQNMPGAYGNIRGAMQGRVNLLERSAQELEEMYAAASGAGPGGRGRRTALSPEAELAFQERFQDVGRQQAAAFQQASYGWEGRLISQALNAPGNWSLLQNRFSVMQAVTHGGVRNPQMGSTLGNLPFFMRFAGVTNFAGHPFQSGPYDSDNFGVAGMGGAPFTGPAGNPNFLPSADPGQMPSAGSGGGATPSGVGPMGGGAPIPPGMGGGGTYQPPSTSPRNFMPPTVPGQMPSAGTGGGAKPAGTGPHHNPASSSPHPRPGGWDARMRPGETAAEYIARRNAASGVPGVGAGGVVGPGGTVSHDGGPRPTTDTYLNPSWSGAWNGGPIPGEVEIFYHPSAGTRTPGIGPPGITPAPRVSPPARPNAAPVPAQASGGVNAAGAIQVHITGEFTLKALDGRELAKTDLGSGGGATAVTNGVGQGGLNDYLNQMGYSTPKQG